jgi:hypothetical protein
LRRWLNRPDCPQIIKEFKSLFDKAFTVPKDPNLAAFAPESRNLEHAHYSFNNVTFSRASTHLGNSLVLYHPPDSDNPVVGSIQKIKTHGDSVAFTIKRQAPLPTGKFDPFQRYPALGAKVYSTDMLAGHDIVSPFNVVSHVARFEFEGGRAVFLNLSKVRKFLSGALCSNRESSSSLVYVCRIFFDI